MVSLFLDNCYLKSNIMIYKTRPNWACFVWMSAILVNFGSKFQKKFRIGEPYPFARSYVLEGWGHANDRNKHCGTVRNGQMPFWMVASMNGRIYYTIESSLSSSKSSLHKPHFFYNQAIIEALSPLSPFFLTLDSYCASLPSAVTFLKPYFLSSNLIFAMFSPISCVAPMNPIGIRILWLSSTIFSTCRWVLLPMMFHLVIVVARVARDDALFLFLLFFQYIARLPSQAMATQL